MERGRLLILVQKGEKRGGFFLKRKAKQGKLPPTVMGLQLGKYPCVLLECYGNITPGNQFLLPYLRRGDVVIPAKNLEKLGLGEPYIQELTRRQCVNTAKEWVAKGKKGLQTVLIDPTAQCVGVAAELCGLGKPVWVVTPKGEDYAPCAEYCMLTFGNPPVVARSVPSSADLVIAPYGGLPVELPQKVPVIAPNRIWARKEDLSLPKEIGDFIPNGFDPVAVAAGCMAMYGAGMEEKACLPLEVLPC